MPTVDFNYWWANAKPGPKHFCTNANPGLATDFFDNNAGSTSVSDHSLPGNGEMTPAGSDYTCQVVEGGVLKGEMSWNHTTHVMTIFGTSSSTATTASTTTARSSTTRAAPRS